MTTVARAILYCALDDDRRGMYHHKELRYVHWRRLNLLNMDLASLSEVQCAERQASAKVVDDPNDVGVEYQRAHQFMELY